MTTRRAACNCGRLEIICEGEPVRISMCHCLECQRRTGTVFGGQAWFAQQQTTISGNSTQFTRQSDAGRSVSFRFCPICGSTVYWEAQAFPDHIAIAVGSLLIPPSRPPHTLAGNRNDITGLSRFAPWLSTIQIDTASHRFTGREYKGASVRTGLIACNQAAVTHRSLDARR